MYLTINMITERFGLKLSENGCPLLPGLLVNSVLFGIIVLILLSIKANKCATYNAKDKLIVSIVGGLLFLLIASPFLYQVLNSLTSKIGMVIADAGGCPNLGGLLLTSVIFILVVRVLMR
jgi:hypothetical protein